jgi:hypothetical protein
MKKLLIINPDQFGHRAGYYYYCKYLKSDFIIEYICFDENLPKISLQDINITYLKKGKFKFFNRIKFFSFCLNIINNFDVVIINYNRGCSVFSIFKKKKILLDIRTADVNKKKYKRIFFDFLLKLESNAFKYIMILSENLMKKLDLPSEKCFIVPLGSEMLSASNKSFNELKMLYVGVITQRKIFETILGLKLFKDLYPNIAFTYNIVGFGNDKDISNLKNTINDCDLNNEVIFHGRKNINELSIFFDISNIGICYVPQEEFFQFQPSTKIFEYILSGLLCIATNTVENRLIISEQNGIICEDNPKSFCDSLYILHKKIKMYNSNDIRKTLNNNLWENIVNNSLKPIIKKVI